MQNILLVEPEYLNKYPPLGLMKISTFHKEYRKDYVKFVKGIKSREELPKKWDRIYITTLFTFDYDIVIKTINHYKSFVENPNTDIIIGGILASLLSEKIENEVKIKPFIGQITSASQIGYESFKEINVDILPLDYDILSEIDYIYPAGDNYFGYTSRGCPNKCQFCAVPKLEPNFKITNNIFKQITEINEKYGEKRNLLLMDNNILYAPNLEEIIINIKSLGFNINEKTYKKPLNFEIIFKRILRREQLSKEAYQEEIIKDTIFLIESLKQENKILDKNMRFKEILEEIEKLQSLNLKLEKIKLLYDEILEILKKYKTTRNIQRYVDFNQGTDARLLNEEKMKLLSQIPIRPYRIAFDDINLKKIYISAIKLANKYGVKHFSNYLLYNFKDKPEDLWERIKINIDLAEELKITDLFSFPMKYSPIEETNRKMIGQYWTKKEISNIYAILNAKKGIVPKKREYFEIAFGKTKEEFKKLLSYPRDFLIYRNFFKEIGYTQKWEKLYSILSEEEKKILLNFQNEADIDFEKYPKLKEAFFFFKLNKKKVELVNKLLKEKGKNYSFEKIFSILKELYENNISKSNEIQKYIFDE